MVGYLVSKSKSSDNNKKELDYAILFLVFTLNHISVIITTHVL